ncbi:MAG: UvrD-helicase domain-containing protein [Chloroflexi bacterium]|nr:UvrD-helicase domain-containing protein [Chloroflexota bacterium]MCY3582884.1 UvrD-helicase domain-containing protein [Chloroflexota bacterium]MCY3715682.1 UvrD-helicase domain-containing protein [Chloroflexota bacterium]MDE2650580.1 UvrD-helicase domain-containing protein [Chloroflexota bacterium]MXV91898.1 AAA family ATPase [Chloroflexota bacterium]
MQPTEEQRAAIYIHDKNLIVVAGAGSGKTRILVERYLQLLDTNPSWRIHALVAITFTKAAAWEMRDRLRSELQRRAQPPGGERWARRLTDLDSARIDTIHGLCADLLRANAAQAGIDPLFEVLDETDAAILLSDAVADVLAEVEAPLTKLFAQVDAFQIKNSLRDLALVQADTPPLPADAEEIFAQWQREWSESALVTRDQLMRSAEVTALADLPMPPVADKLAELARQYADYLRQIAAAQGAQLAQRLLQECHREGKVGNIGSVKNWGGQAAKTHAARILRDLRERIEADLKFIGEPPGELDRASAEALRLWDGLFRQVRQRYTALKRERAWLDFGDLESLAAQLLQNDHVRERYRGAEFKHLLVDEFQDTNRAQWQIIQSLADINHGGSLFAVGDPKQSIYQFRGADVSVFERVRKQIAGQAQGMELPLATSFRTHRRLLEQFNALFSRLLTRDEGSPTRDYEVRFDQPMRTFRMAAPQDAALELLLLDKGVRDGQGEPVRGRNRRQQNYPADDMRRWEAFQIAQRIHELVTQERPVHDRQRGGWRPIRYGDIAILFRSLNKAPLYEDVFKARGLPFLTVAGRGYFDRQEVWDMLDLLRTLHNPADDLSLAAALRSPMFAFSDDLLLGLRLVTAGSAQPLPLWQALHMADETCLGITPDDLPRLQQARAALGELQRMAGRVSISELLRYALAATHYLAILTGLPDGDRRRGNIEKLLQLADDSSRSSLGEFSQYLSDLTTREAREGEALLKAHDSLRLMTVHASKGLEFPMVILADAAWHRMALSPLLLADAQRGLSCKVYAPNNNRYESGFAHKRNINMQRLKEAAEAKRLLYVAATRAQDVLLISGAVSQTKNNLWNARGWLGQLLKALELEDIPRETTQDVCLAGHPLRVVMPEGPPDAMLWQQTAQPDANLWHVPVDANAYPPQMPPLLQTLPEPPALPSHITVSQLEDLGEARFSAEAKSRRAARLRFREAALHDLPRAQPLNLSRRIPRRQIGLIVHELLRHSAFQGRAEPSAEAIDAIAWQHGATNPATLAGIQKQVRRLLKNYARSDVCGWIKSARAANRRVYTELPFIFRRRNRVIHGAMDVLLQDADGLWRVIDYKTGDAGGDFQRHARQYRLQLGVYAAAVQEQLSLRAPPLTYVHYLRDNHTVQLANADCQAELERLEATLDEGLGEHD